jgi:hypothetical protein
MPLDALIEPDPFKASVPPVIEVAGAGDTQTLTSLISMIDRQGIVKTGPGTLRYVPATLASGSRWSLGISQGLVEVNQLPYHSGQNNFQGQPTGDLDFVGTSTLRVLSDPSIVLPSLTSNFGCYGYGFANVRVANGVTGTIEVESGAVFKTTGRTDTSMDFLGSNSTLVLSGTDLTSLFQFGYGTAGGTIDEGFVNRTIDLRGGLLSFFGSGAIKTFWPQTVDFTMKLNGGEHDGRNEPGLQSLPGNLVINDNPTASDPRVRAWIVNDTGGSNASYGNIICNGALVKVGSAGDTLSFNRNVTANGTGGYVSIAPDAVLDVDGGIVTVAGVSIPSPTVLIRPVTSRSTLAQERSCAPIGISASAACPEAARSPPQRPARRPS